MEVITFVVVGIPGICIKNGMCCFCNGSGIIIIIIIKYGRLLSTVTKEIYSLCTTVLRYLKTVGKNLTLKEYHNNH